MKYVAQVLAVIGFAGLSGCAHQYTMPPDPRVFGDETLSIETWDGQWHTAQAVSTDRGPAWDAGEDVPIPAFNVKTVVRSNVGRHVGIGTGVGALVGFAVGAAIGLSRGDDHCVEDENHWCIMVMSAEEKAVIGGILMHAVGAAAGALIGGTTATKDVFVAPSLARLRVPEVSLLPVRGGAAGGLRWTF